MSNKFSDGSSSAFAELPVPAAYLSWTRGNAQLKAIAQADPGAYFGGWRAFVTDKDGNDLPKLPIPIVDRMSEDGKHPYKVYATNVLSLLPIQHRTRFELREKTKDVETGREYEKVVAVSSEKRQGYAPYRQVFGLVFGEKEFAPAVLKIYKWSAFISFERAGQVWNKITTPEGKVVIRRYGSVGVTENGMVVPNFEIYGQGRSTPIEAIDAKHPRYYDITPELDALFDQSLAWKNCERWNAEGKVNEEPASIAVRQEFLARCDAMGLSNIDIEQLLKESNNDYEKALALLNPDEMDINTELAAGDTAN
jgi:hypothetical protein